jgi:hypothetical protein
VSSTSLMAAFCSLMMGFLPGPASGLNRL